MRNGRMIRRPVRGFGIPQSGGGGAVAPPVNTVAPLVSVPALYEIGVTATCDGGTFTGSGVTKTYQWYIRGVAITGATSSTYVLLGADLGGSGPTLTSELFGDASFSAGQGPPLTCGVTATNAGGSTAEIASSNNVRFDWAQYSANITQLMDERGITSSGGFIDAWANQGSVSASFTATLTTRPATGRTVNGFAAPDFDGTNDVLNTTATCRSFVSPGSSMDNTRYLYLWRIADIDAFNTAADGVRPSQLPDVGSGNMAFSTQQDAAGTLTAETAAYAGVAPTGYRISSQTGTTGTHVQETRLVPGTITQRWDGTDASAATFNGHTTAPGAAHVTRIGANYSTTPNQWFNGAIGTEIAWAATSAITSAELNTIRAVLAGKYGVTTGYVAP